MKNNERIPSGKILEKKEKSGCMIAAVVLGCILTAIVAGAVWLGLELRLRMDVIGTQEKMRQVDKALFAYTLSYGCYPPQQDMKSLLKTLGLKDSDFQKVWLTDIKSAEYHAPAEDSNDPEDRLVTMRAKDQLRFVRRDGSVGNESLKSIASRTEPEQEKERSAAIPEPNYEKQ